MVLSLSPPEAGRAMEDEGGPPSALQDTRAPVLGRGRSQWPGLALRSAELLTKHAAMLQPSGMHVSKHKTLVTSKEVAG